MMADKKILIIGSRGQIGRALLEILGKEAVGVASTQLDLAKTDSIAKFLQNYNPIAVINTAAYTGVDKAESERDAAFALNALAPEIMAKFCCEKNIPFVHYSTDYVYSGCGNHFMTENEEYGPINHYGVTKLEGDRRVEAVGGKFLIFRICWVYDVSGKNFLNTILRLAAEKSELAVINDQFGAPTFSGDIARATIDCLSKGIKFPIFPSGVYNLCSSGETNWYDYARMIVERARYLGANLLVDKILPILTTDYVTPARRPLNSRLSTEKIKRVFGISMPLWQDTLERVLMRKYASN
ncbi:MAG: hypothetical protein A4S09_02385 [Proteobacteria bacterium SG_bin7]|nr:MAG: hypothetical protein A4S09_02385 [Proteobacteria bacterium SG_bin7]